VRSSCVRVRGERRGLGKGRGKNSNGSGVCQTMW
jgi:hypothetical protein